MTWLAAAKLILRPVAPVDWQQRSGVPVRAWLLDQMSDSLRAMAQPREDVGRHNAVDKVVGWALDRGELPLTDALLCVSGRLSFELVQKAVVAGAPVLVGVGAPTSLAVALATDANLTLCGFARSGRVNVYAAPQRVA